MTIPGSAAGSASASTTENGKVQKRMLPPESSELIEPTKATDPDAGELHDAVSVANIPTLLMVLVQMTGDLTWLEPPYTLERTKGMSDNDTGGLSEDLQTRIRAAASDALAQWRAGRPLAIPDPSRELVVRMLGVSMGARVSPEYGDLFRHELAVGAGNAPHAGRAPVPTGFRAVVIGAGVSGIAAAARMLSLGIDVLILEKGDDVGGVWQDNRYPGAGVDTPSHLYSYSFAPHDWSQYFATRDQIHSYLGQVATDFGVRERIRFGSEVLRAEYDETASMWHVQVRGGDGAERTETANIVLSCVGAFNRPVVPKLAGLADFAGPAFHTAQWPTGLSVEGKKVAVIGNGASAMQTVPAIAGTVDQLTVFQRSPQWAQPFEKFQQEVPEPTRLLFREVPLFRAWYRLRLSWIFHDKIYRALQRDPDWSESQVAINEVNDGHRQYFTEYIRSQLGDREDLAEKVIPQYPPFGKRMLFDNGWFKTLILPNVHLVTEAISEIRPAGIVAASGTFHEADVIVFATGFDVVRFLSTYEVVGRDGETLREAWDDVDCRAYLGLTVPGFPNLFSLYGPNTSTGHGGSLIHNVEAQLDYVEDLLRQMFDQGISAVDCRVDVYDEYAKTVDAMHQNMIWTHPAMSTYYRNDRGRVVVINPFRNVDFWRLTRHADLADYHTTRPAAASGATTESSQPSQRSDDHPLTGRP